MKKFNRIKLLFLVFVISLVPLIPESAKVHADTLGNMTTYALPGTNPLRLVEGPDSNLWVTGSVYDPNTWTTDYIVYKVTKTGTYTAYHHTGTNDFGIIIGSDNNIWTSGIGAISKVTSNGQSTRYNLPSGNASTSHGLTSGPDDDIWFGMNGTKEVNGQYISVDQIGRVTTSGTFPTPYSLTDGEHVSSLTEDNIHKVVWYGTSGTKYAIGEITSEGVQTEYSLPFNGLPQDITMGPDGNIWFSTGNQIGKMTPSGTFTFYNLSIPSGSGLQQIAWGRDGYLWATISNSNQVVRIAMDGNATFYPLPSGSGAATDITAGSDGNMWAITSSSHALIKIDTGYSDSDGDGIPDSIESPDYPGRDAIFCNTTRTSCAYPDPAVPDIYVETDWMVDPNGNSYRPTDAELDVVQTAYANHGIYFHYDNGQYGGGNQVPYNDDIYWRPTSGYTDFLDYKYGGDGIPAQFDSTNRDGIWHYMLFGYQFQEDQGVSGVSTASGPDSFVSYGLIKDRPSAYSSFDTAIEGTIIHELGHTLCLTSGVYYPDEPQACIFAGVDSPNQTTPSYPDYISSMNYLYQMQMVDYSSGTNGSTSDHDDWDALHLDAFNRFSGDVHGASIQPSKTQRRTLDGELHKTHSVTARSMRSRLNRH